VWSVICNEKITQGFLYKKFILAKTKNIDHKMRIKNNCIILFSSRLHVVSTTCVRRLPERASTAIYKLRSIVFICSYMSQVTQQFHLPSPVNFLTYVNVRHVRLLILRPQPLRYHGDWHIVYDAAMKSSQSWLAHNKHTASTSNKSNNQLYKEQ